jgi:hypothetical protein
MTIAPCHDAARGQFFRVFLSTGKINTYLVQKAVSKPTNLSASSKKQGDCIISFFLLFCHTEIRS